MNIDYKNEQFKKVNDNFNYIQKEFEEIEHQINFRFGNYFNFEINVNELIKLLKFDKKNTCKTINFSLPTAIGNVTVNHEIEINKVKSFLVEFLQND